MKLFIDTANPEDIKKYWDYGVICGVTTNPSLASKVGIPYQDIVKQIFEIVDGPISLEVLSTDYEGILKEARALSLLNKNVVVKIPLIKDGIKALKVLSSEGIKTNMTLVFSVNQAILAANNGASYVSPFIGRLDDNGENGLEVLENIVKVFKNYNYTTKLLAASLRDINMVKNAALIGADYATLPPNVIEEMYKHELTDKGLSKFLEDFKSQGLTPLV